MPALPESAREILEKRAFVFLATSGPDGHPHVSPVWADLEDGRLVMSTAEGRVKHDNLQRDPRVSLSAIDPDDPYNAVTLKGRVTMTMDGGVEQIDRLSKKYLEKDPFPGRKPGQVWVRALFELED